MIFQDGGGMIREDGNGYKVPVVLDNLIHKRDIPPMIAIFINPGVLPAGFHRLIAKNAVSTGLGFKLHPVSVSHSDVHKNVLQTI